MKYKIADIVLDVDGTENEYISERMKEYACDKSESTDVVISYSRSKEISYPADFNNASERIAGWKWYFDKDTITAFDVNDRIDFIMSSVMWNSEKKRAVIQACDTCPFSGIKLSEGFFNLVGHAFSFIAPEFDTFVFHSSAIAYDDFGVLISAPSGTGKSTHAGLWKRHFPDRVEIINDDTPAIKKCGSEFFVCGTPWSGKTKINTPKQVPLKAIVCIRQAKENMIKKLDFKTAFYCIFNEIRKMPEEKHIGKVLDLTNQMLLKVPVYELSCNISYDAVQLLKNTLDLK